MLLRTFLAASLIFISPSLRAKEIVIAGTGNGSSVLQAVSGAFMAENPETLIIIPPSVHTEGGFKQLIDNEAQIARVGRNLTDKENELGLASVTLAKFKIVYYINKSAGVKILTRQQVARIFSGEIHNWKDVGGKDEKIRIAARPEYDSSIMELRKHAPEWKDLVWSKNNKITSSTQSAIDLVSITPGGITVGFYTKGYATNLDVIELEGHHPTNPKYNYPTVAINLIYKTKDLDDEKKKFFEFIKTDKINKLITAMGAIPAN